MSEAVGGERWVRDRVGHIVGAVTNRVLVEVDPDLIVDQLDVEALVARIDPDLLLDRVDVDRLLARVDVNAVLDRVDVDRILDRVDPDRLLDRVDADRLLARVDADAVVARVDVEAIVRRIDVEELVQRAGIPDIVADSTGQIAGSALDLGRRQLVAVDVTVWRIVQRLLRRDPAALPAGPEGLVVDEHDQVAAPDPGRSRVRARAEVSGYYAGPVSRLAAFAGDVALSTTLFTGAIAAGAWLLSVVFGLDVEGDGRAGPLVVAAAVVWAFLYWWTTTSVAGRTPAMMLAGLRIVMADGAPLHATGAVVRVLALPLSTLGFLGGAWMMVDRQRRAVHDLLARTAVVYDWGGRPAEMPTPLVDWLDRRDHDTP